MARENKNKPSLTREEQSNAVAKEIRQRFACDSQPINNGEIKTLSEFMDVIAIPNSDIENEIDIFAEIETSEQLDKAANELNQYKI